MKLKRIAPIIGLVGLSYACTVVFVGDLEVQWSVEGVQSASKCADFGVDKWRINVMGPSLTDQYTTVCGDNWNTGNFFYGIEEGIYDVTVEALDTGGTVIGSRTKAITLRSDASVVWTATIDLLASDFGAAPVCDNGTCEAGETEVNCPEDCTSAPTGKIVVAWTINGTVDGTATGQSWDDCAEVGATDVAITIDGNPATYACAANGMSATIDGLADGTHTVKVALIDDTGELLTTEASGDLTASASPAVEAFDFPFNAFLGTIKTDTSGDYLWKALFEGVGCGASGAAQQIVLLKLDGTPLTTNNCADSGSSCTATNGSDFGICHNTDQRIVDLVWGAYKMRVQAVPNGSSEICWETEDQGSSEIDILVGAGTVNPVVTHDLARISTAGDCNF